MVEQFPRASFGKSRGASAYEILEKDAAFDPPQISRAFQKICTSFEWKPTAEETTHPPCFAILPLGDATLVARYTDSGRDLVGRPHTLRIDCILTPQEKFAEAWRSIAPDEEPVPLPAKDTLKVIGDPVTHTAKTP